MTRMEHLLEIYRAKSDYSVAELVDIYRAQNPYDKDLKGIERDAYVVVKGKEPEGTSKVLVKYTRFDDYGSIDVESPEGYRLKQVLPHHTEKEGVGRRNTIKVEAVIIVWEKIEF